jgi:hypothetical protein
MCDVIKEQLIEYCYKFKEDYIYDVGSREFDCLISLIDDDEVTSFEDLAKYGMDYGMHYEKQNN